MDADYLKDLSDQLVQVIKHVGMKREEVKALQAARTVLNSLADDLEQYETPVEEGNGGPSDDKE